MTPFTSPTKRKDGTTLYSPETSPTMRKTLIFAFPALLLLMVSGVGAECGESLIPRPGEVLVMCPLNEDVGQTKHSVVISFPYKGDAVTVFGCDWLADNPDTPDCFSHYGFTLEDLKKDCVVASVPRSLVQNDTYQCQLVRPDEDQIFTECHSEHPPTTISAVTSSTAADQSEEEPTGANGDYPGGLVAAVVALSFTVFILLLMVVVMAVLFLRLKIYRFRRTPVVTLGNEEKPLNGVA